MNLSTDGQVAIKRSRTKLRQAWAGVLLAAFLAACTPTEGALVIATGQPPAVATPSTAWYDVYFTSPEVTAEQMEIARLRAENARLKMERDIAKKAAAYFAQDVLQSTLGSGK